MHVDVTGRNQRQARHASKVLQHLKPRVIVRPPEQLDSYPGAIREREGDAVRIRDLRLMIGHQQRQAAIDAAFKVIPRNAVATFLGATPCGSDEFGQAAVGLAVGREEHDPRTVRNTEL